MALKFFSFLWGIVPATVLIRIGFLLVFIKLYTLYGSISAETRAHLTTGKII